MSDTATLRLPASAGWISRIVATIDRMLMAHAGFAARNGDLPYFGL
jgi:hypothetical protein